MLKLQQSLIAVFVLLALSLHLTPVQGGSLSSQRATPLVFEPNQGQAEPNVRFLSRGPDYTLFLTSGGVALRFPEGELNAGKRDGRRRTHGTSGLDMRFLGAAAAGITGADPLPGQSHYVLGNDPSRWNREIRQYGKVRYAGLYPGIDLVFHADRRQLEYDLIVNPGADPASVVLELDRAAWTRKEADVPSTGEQRTASRLDAYWSASIDDEGALLLQNGTRRIRQLAPILYQERDGRMIPVSGRYVAKGGEANGQSPRKGTILVGFEVEAYDTARPLVIDPQIVFSMTVQANGPMSPSAYYVDAAGNAYVGGATLATVIPGNSGLQPALAGGFDAYVVKISPQGTILFSAYLGGAGEDRTNGIAVDATGSIYLTGTTASSGFPTRNPIHEFRGSDAFVTKLNASGTAILYSTFLGGAQADAGSGIAVDGSGNAYVVGTTGSSNFPLQGAFQATYRGGQDLFVSKVNAAGSALVYSSYLGGTQFEASGADIAVDSTGNAYIGGDTQSTDFPTASPFQNRNRGSNDVVVVKLNAAGAALVYSTYVGGDSSDSFNGIAVDAAGSVFVTGNTSSSNFPTQSPFQAALSGTQDVFVFKLSSSGSALVYASYLGGSEADSSGGIAVDAVGHAYLGGRPSAGFPTKNPIQTSGPAFLAQISTSGAEIEFSTYVGGSDSLFGVGIGLVPAGLAKAGDAGDRQDLLTDILVDLFLLFRNNSLPQLFQVDTRETVITPTEEFADNCIRIVDTPLAWRPTEPLHVPSTANSDGV